MNPFARLRTVWPPSGSVAMMSTLSVLNFLSDELNCTRVEHVLLVAFQVPVFCFGPPIFSHSAVVHARWYSVRPTR